MEFKEAYSSLLSNFKVRRKGWPQSIYLKMVYRIMKIELSVTFKNVLRMFMIPALLHQMAG